MDCWHDEIDKATSETQIVQAAGEYLLLWAPRELPPETLGLERMRIESREDIYRVSERFALAPVKVDRASPGSAHLRELAQYFRHAARRLRELRPIPAREAPRFSASL